MVEYDHKTQSLTIRCPISNSEDFFKHLGLDLMGADDETLKVLGSDIYNAVAPAGSKK